MKSFLNQEFYGNRIENWLISLALIVGAIILAKFLYWFVDRYVKRLTAKTKSNLDDILIDKLEEPVVYGVGMLGFYWAFQRLSFAPGVDRFFDHLFIIIFTLNLTWLFVRIIDSLILEYLMPLVQQSESDLDDHLMPVVRKLVKLVFWSLGIIIGLNNAGFDVAALIAGLGIGGLALALAAQDTVKNIFGGIMIYLDKPFKVKDRIIINSFDGFVEEVGIRSTRIRTLEGRLVTIPNARFSEDAIVNITKEPARKVVVQLGLTYQTPPEKMDVAMDILKKIATEMPELEENVIVSFMSWGDFSLGIQLIYFIKVGEDFFKVQNDVNMQILRQFNEQQLQFAYPTQTIYRK